MAEEFLRRSLCLDLETDQNHRILKIGALLPSRGFPGRGKADVFRRQGRFDMSTALDELDELAKEADFVLGHNLLGHDLRVLLALSPRLALLSKPVVDTLYLSPLAFPENPYHHLIKDYKLVRQALNDPVADAELAADVFRDQWASLKSMPRERLAFYATSFSGFVDPFREGLSTVLTELSGRQPMTGSRALSYVATSLAGKICRTGLRRLAAAELKDPVRKPALGYAVAWLQVAGGNSVLPPWVRHQFPATVTLLNALREQPCADPDCIYCIETHAPRRQLFKWFRFEGFRPEPKDETGNSLQEAVVRSGLGGRSHLAILATGAGKSVCYQLPALVRYLRRGSLTIVISPLQALMKDQVDNLHAATGHDCAAALYGLLTPPERGKVLESVRLGDVAILYVAPEQLRNRSFRRVIEQREIGCWVFDEAHCLSKWGHDFRPDYLYAARFIRESAERQRLTTPPVACFTATAKQDVKREIIEYFEDQLGGEMVVFESRVEREELRFRVEPVRSAEKLPRIHELLAEYHSTPERSPAGSAVVYFATRRAATEAAVTLNRLGTPAAVFHGGMKAPEKRETLEAFVNDELRVVCATNAFGMGIDKSDVRLVIHADIPGSLESYLQEAGRAGRDRRPSDCVLLFDQDDIEKQFRLSASSRISQRDIAGILRGLRRARRREDDAIVVTGGDLLRNEAVTTEFDSTDRQAETKVRTAVAWLERSGFVKRDENETRVFQGKLKIRSLEEARRRLSDLSPRLRLSAAEQKRWLAILAALINADPDTGLSADELAELPGVGWGLSPSGSSESPGQKVIRTLHSLAEAGFMSSGLQLTAFLKPAGPKSAPRVFEALCGLERAMLDLLAENEPDADTGEWLDLSLRLLNQRLSDRGHQSSPRVLQQLLRSLAQDGKGLAGRRGSLELVFRSRNYYRVRLRRRWRSLRELAERRRALGRVLLDLLLAKVPTKTTSRVLVEFSSDEITAAIRGDLALRSQIRDPLAAAERGLLFLHEQKVVHLQNGLAVFRQAMTIRILPRAKGRRYGKGEFAPLQMHYDERVFQTHVMARYASLGLAKIRAALSFVGDYFALGKKAFVEAHFQGQEDILSRATDRESYAVLVERLRNPAQMALVTAPVDRTMLVLAGPGSGKTRVVVHRCGYLLRVARVPARSILVLCFNRNACLELRHRLRALVGEDARGVTVLTYHGLAMRFTGTSFAAAAEEDGHRAGRFRRTSEGAIFDTLIPAAVRLLTSDDEVVGLQADEVRDQILSGYSHILVDEYQDINQAQYDLLSAVAGRSESDRNRQLAMLAVGDDDQTIYGWSGAKVEFIQRFREDYRAESHCLLESYRSTKHILAAADQLIRRNQGRMKSDSTIRVDSARESKPPGGRWSKLDPAGEGRVRRLRVCDASAQAAAICDRLFHLRRLDPDLAWSDIAILARRHNELAPIRSLLEHRGVPVAWTADRDRLPPLHRVREIAEWLEDLREHRNELRSASWIEGRLATLRGDHEKRTSKHNAWWVLAHEILEEWREEFGDAEIGIGSAMEFIYEALTERSREIAFGRGVRLTTVHAAKGLEFKVVFMSDGAWGGRFRDGASEEERRLYYVGLTRARELLHLCERTDLGNPFLREITGDFVELDEPQVAQLPESVIRRRYGMMGLQDLYLSFAGRRPKSDRIHSRLGSLRAGDALFARGVGDHLRLFDSSGEVVASMSSEGADRWRERLGSIEEIKVVAMVERRSRDSEPAYRDRLRCENWEVPVLEVAFVGDDELK